MIISALYLRAMVFDTFLPLSNCFLAMHLLSLLKDLSVETLIVKCKGIFSLLGLPDCVLSDRGAQFVSFEFCNFLSKFNVPVRKMSTNAYTPSSNGCSERFNATLQKNISSYLTQMRFPRYSWTKALPTALLSYRSTVHTATKCRPVDLFFRFNVKGFGVFQAENSSTTCSVCSSTRHASPERLPDALRPGQPVFVKFPYSAKFADKGRSGVVSRHINQRTVRVSLSDGSYVDAAVHRISLLPWDSDSSSGRGAWPGAGSDAAESLGDSLPSLPLPCSQPHGSSSLSAASS